VPETFVTLQGLFHRPKRGTLITLLESDLSIYKTEYVNTNEIFYLPCLLYFGLTREIIFFSLFAASLILENCSIWTFEPGTSFKCSRSLSWARPFLAIPV